MRPYNYPDSDIDETEMVIQVKCTNCLKVTPVTILKESLPEYRDNGDGTHTDLAGECFTCLTT